MQPKKVAPAFTEETVAAAEPAAPKVDIQALIAKAVSKSKDEPATAPEDQQPQVLSQEKADKRHHHNEETSEAPAEDSSQVKTKDLLKKVKNAAEKMKKSVHEQADTDEKTVALVNKVKTSA